MTRFIIPLAIVVAAALLGGAYFWAAHPPAYAVNAAEVIDHHFVVAAYTVTWTIQLGYLTRLALKWRNQKRPEDQLDRTSR